MNLLTDGFVNNCGRLFGPSEQFEADIVDLGLKRFCVNGRESRYPCRRFRADNGLYGSNPFLTRIGKPDSEFLPSRPKT
jgi:hypothetical protein